MLTQFEGHGRELSSSLLIKDSILHSFLGGGGVGTADVKRGRRGEEKRKDTGIC